MNTKNETPQDDRHPRFSLRAARMMLILWALVAWACDNAKEEPPVPPAPVDDIVYFGGGVTFSDKSRGDYRCAPKYEIFDHCFEMIDGHWYALEFNANYAGGSDVNLIVDGQKKETILTDCYSVKDAFTYVKDNKLHAYIFYFESEDKYRGVEYADGKIKSLGELQPFDRILFLREDHGDIYTMWTLNTPNFLEVGNIVILKNGTPIDERVNLQEGTSLYRMWDMEVENGNVYTFFTLKGDYYTEGGYYAVGGRKYKTTGLTNPCYGQVSDGEVIIEGYNQQPGWIKSLLWKDGNTRGILAGMPVVSPRGLKVVNGDVYYLVTCFDERSRESASTMYKNGAVIGSFPNEFSGFKVL